MRVRAKPEHQRHRGGKAGRVLWPLPGTALAQVPRRKGAMARTCSRSQRSPHSHATGSFWKGHVGDTPPGATEDRRQKRTAMGRARGHVFHSHRCTHMHTYTRVCTHCCARTRASMSVCAYTCMCAHTCTHSCMHLCADTPTRVCGCGRAPLCAHMSVCMCTHMHVCMCPHTHTPAGTHVLMPARAHGYTHMRARAALSLGVTKHAFSSGHGPGHKRQTLLAKKIFKGHSTWKIFLIY